MDQRQVMKAMGLGGPPAFTPDAMWDTRHWWVTEGDRTDDGLYIARTVDGWTALIETESERPRCGAQRLESLHVCPLWVDHDCPHLPCSDELDVSCSRLVVVAMNSPRQRVVTA